MPLGVGALAHVTRLTLLIVGLFGIVFLSYRQTIDAYPNGGGSYTVAKENLGQGASLVAAAALSLDYMLNVAVGISAGVGALVSAVPSLLPSTLPLCLGTLGALVIVNLRGVRSAGAMFMVPTYTFVGTLLTVLALAAVAAARSAGHPVPVVAPPAIGPSTEAVSLWLLVRAFANGCTAMTGVEAVSNGVPIFRDPSTRGARRTLGAIIGVLIVLLLGVAMACRAYRVGATPPGRVGYESVLSQLTGAVVGRGWFYDVTMAAVIAVLALSANTSFADLPRLCRLLALDGFLPETFAHRGRRLVFSHGIIVLGVASGTLLVAFRGVTAALIPLFALGAFLAFTLSQAGMVRHWRRRRGNRGKLLVNGIGAAGTGITFVIITTSKFLEGAWLSILIVLVLIALFLVVRRHNDFVLRATRTDAALDVCPSRAPLAVVPLLAWNAETLKALHFAIGFARDVVALQVLSGDRPADDLTHRWADLVERPAHRLGLASAPRLVVLRSEYRRLYTPVLDYVTRMADEHSDRQVAVVVPETVEPRWWDFLLGSHRSIVVRDLFLLRGKPQIVVVSAPFYLGEWVRERRRLRVSSS
jgi:amino acid transporter